VSPSESPSARADRIAGLVAALEDDVAAAQGDGAIAALDPAVARRLLGVAARCYEVAAEEGAAPLAGADVTPTAAVVVATAALKAHDLNPFDLALWFSRSSS
jgi:hypothetical protein